ncbi:hypothetical protein LXA43DRAFT_907044, partial [Ganoderma leucocontextum]
MVVQLCGDCGSAVRRNKIPPLAVANYNFLGEVPLELRELTFIEEQIVALSRAKCCIIHMKQDGEPASNLDSEGSRRPNAQRGFKGHIVIYPQRPGEVAQALPPPLADLVTPVCVIFVGSNAPSLDWLRKKAKPLIVRREKIRAALQWLKDHNVLYKDIRIDDDHLNTLPDDDILPVHIEHVLPTAAQSVLTSHYDGVQDETDDEGTQLGASSRTINRDEVSFSKVVVTDVDGRAPANELHAAAVRHIKEKGGAYLEVPHGPRPVNEFCNPSLLPQLYPCLFPYGVGGFEDDNRQSRVSFQRHVRH